MKLGPQAAGVSSLNLLHSLVKAKEAGIQGLVLNFLIS